MVEFFKPSDIQAKMCSVINIAKGGSAFASCEGGDQVFIPPKIVETLGIEPGDLLMAQCIDNHRADADRAYSARWRAIKVDVEQKLDKPVRQAETAALAAGSDADLVLGLLRSTDRLWTGPQMAFASKVGVIKVNNVLRAEHDRGGIAAVKVYASGDQQRATSVFYGRNIDLIYEMIDEVELGE